MTIGRIQVEEAIVVGLYPELFLAIDKQVFKSTRHTVFFQPSLRMTVTMFGHGVEYAIAHALTKPQLAIGIFKNLTDIV